MLREKAFDFDDEAFGFVRAVLVGQKIETLRDDGLSQGGLVDDTFGYDDDLTGLAVCTDCFCIRYHRSNGLVDMRFAHLTGHATYADNGFDHVEFLWLTIAKQNDNHSYYDCPDKARYCVN